MKKSIILYLLVLYIIVSLYKFAHSINLPQFDYTDDTGYFTSEAAFHYRHAKMIAEGRQLPKIDYQIQYPEGVDISKHFTIFSEYAYAIPYRLITQFFPLPFHLYLLIILSFTTSLNIFIIYLLSLDLWQSNRSAFISSFIYALAIPALDRVIGWYEYENFAYPFILFSLLLFLRKSFWSAILSAIMLVIASLSWHLTSFYLIVFSIGVAIRFIHSYSFADKIFMRVLILYGGLFFTGMIIPVLKEKGFNASIGMIILASLICSYIVASLLNMKQRMKFLILFCTISISFFLLSSIGNLTNPGDFSHVYHLLYSKFLFLGKKPDNPVLLPIEVRSYWTGPYNSPTLIQFLKSFFPHIILTVISLFVFLNKNLRRHIQMDRIFMYMYVLAVSFLLYILFIRFRSFLIFFTSVIAGGIVFLVPGSSRIKRAFILTLVWIVLIIHSGIFSYFAPPFSKIFQLRSLSYTVTQRINLISWLRSSLPEASVIVMPDFALSTSVATYTSFNVLLHSQFEDQKYREKYYELITNLYQDESDFQKVLKKYKAQYLILDQSAYSNTISGSYRYIAGAVESMNPRSVPYLHLTENENNAMLYFRHFKKVENFDIFQVL